MATTRTQGQSRWARFGITPADGRVCLSALGEPPVWKRLGDCTATELRATGMPAKMLNPLLPYCADA